MVKYVLWLIECSHESGRQFAIMFFGLCCSFRSLLEIFDEQVGAAFGFWRFRIQCSTFSPLSLCLALISAFAHKSSNGVAKIFLFKFSTNLWWRERERDDIFAPMSVELHHYPGPFEARSTYWATAPRHIRLIIQNLLTWHACVTYQHVRGPLFVIS